MTDGPFFRPRLTTLGSLPGSAALVVVGVVIGVVGEWLWAVVFFALAAVSVGMWWTKR